MTASALQRHLAQSALTDYLQGHAPATLAVPGDPVCRFVFDPIRHEMTLRTPQADEELPDLAGFENVDARVVVIDKRSWSEVTVQYGVRGHEAYLLLSDIADMIQQNQIPFPTAVLSALTTFQELLAHTTTLTLEKQIGLYGELLFLESCLRSMPTHTAIGAWKGCAPHEHDFVLPGMCFEIKSTKSEKRRHRIGSLEQLESLPGVPLWLVSVQLTSAGPGSGRTLTQLVDDVCEAAGTARSALLGMLAQAGWRDRDRSLYREHQTLRTVPAAYLVDCGFPLLNRRIIQEGCARPGLIVDAAYTIDVTTLTHGSPPPPADRFVRGAE